MDIAKIRKKLKETDGGGSQPGAESKASNQPQPKGREADDNIPVPPSDMAFELGVPAEESVTEASGTPSLSAASQPSQYESRKQREQEKVKSHPVEESERQGQTPSHREISGVGEFEGEESRTDEIIEILTFKLFREEYAFKISQLKEILKFQRITTVPKMPDYVVGITSLRGKVIPVIDLRTKVSSGADLPGLSSRMKILVMKGPKGLIGAIVDKVLGVVRIAKSEILPPPSHLTEEQLKFIDGVAIIDKRFVSILNMEETIAMNFH